MDESMTAGIVAGAGVLLMVVGLVIHLAYERWQLRLRQHVGAYAEDTVAVRSEVAEPSASNALAERLNSRLRQLSFMPALRNQLISAGINMSASRFLLIQVAVSLVFAWVGLSVPAGLPGTAKLITMLAGAALGYVVVRVYLKLLRGRRIAKLNNQLPDTIDVLAGALEAGSSLAQSMAMAAREMNDPIATEFTRVLRDQELGLSMQEAMQRMLQRCPNQDLDMFITAINIQYRVGGNLSQIMRTIANTIRERIRIRREIRILTAQGRVSAYVITAIPFGLVGIIFLINRPYIMTLFTTGAGQAMTGSALTLIAFGYYIMHRIVSIKV